jgi:hypothetical protein
MEPYDPPEAYSATHFRSHTPGSYKPKVSAKKIFHGIVLGVLTGAVLGLIYLNWYEAKVIAAQRELIIELWKYIQVVCPTGN